MRRITLILSLIIAVSSTVLAQDLDDDSLDSLARMFYTLDDSDTTKLSVCADIARGHYNADSTIAWSERLIELARIHRDAYLEARAYGYMSWAYYYKDEYLAANNCNFRAIIIADSIENNQLKADNYRMLGDNYAFIKDFQQSYQYYSIALDLYEKFGDITMSASCARCMAYNFSEQRMYVQAEDNFRKALEMDSLSGEYDYLVDDHVGLAHMFLLQFLYNSTQKNIKLIEKAQYEIAMADSIKSDFPYSMMNLLELKSALYIHEAIGKGYEGEPLQQLLDTVRGCIEKGHEIVEKLDVADKIVFDVCRANYLTLCKKYEEAKLLLDSMLCVAEDDINSSSYINKLFIAFDVYYTAIGDYKNAYLYKSKFYEGLNNQTTINYAVKAAQDMAQSRFDEQMRQHAEQEAQRARWRKYAAIAVTMILLFALFEIFMTRRHNRVLNNKNELLEKQKEEISEQKLELIAQSEDIANRNVEISARNTQIMDSIRYASLIQKSLMPDEEQMRSMFSDCYLIYRPLNVVAGDFYWMATVGKYKIVVGADSTGHGVPGAFVSVLGINLLNDLTPLVISNGGSPSKILDLMRERLMAALGQSLEKFDRGESMNMDGIDLALAIIDTENNILKYAGAYRPLWIFDGNGINVLKPDKMPIGIYVSANQNFTEQTVPIKTGDVLYMFSDGITDQFGYIDQEHKEYKHFSAKRLLRTVGEMATKPFSEQRSMLESTIDTWQNGYEQLDDIIFLAVKI
ncbi:MAG: serine/threonine-protein phosphatase [Bacteroidales bacterium]|nr:serine/threonine-protein phosphatase [Bacteroidales bacterium]